MRAQYVQMLLLALWGQAVIRRQMIAAKLVAAITSILRFISQGHGASPLQGDAPYLIIFSEYENTDESCDCGSLQGRIARISRGY